MFDWLLVLEALFWVVVVVAAVIGGIAIVNQVRLWWLRRSIRRTR